MNITRHNYEEFFLLYVDNELNIAQRKAVETFVEENPDLRAELNMLKQSVLPVDEQIEFGNKQTLLKTTAAANPVNETNCEEYFILYADDELTNEEKDQVEQFVYRNPQHQSAFEILQQVKLMPDTSIVYPDKYALYRSEEDEKTPVIRIRWWRIAAAAVVLLFAGAMGWYIVTNDGSKDPGTKPSFASTDTNQTKQPVITAPEQTQQQLAEQKKNTTNEAPETVAVTDKTEKANEVNKNNSQALPKKITPVKQEPKEDMAKNNDNKQQKNDVPVRPLVDSKEPPNETMALKPQQVNGVDPTANGLTTKAIGNRDPEVAAIQPKPAAVKPVAAPMEEINPDELFASNNDNKKNKMRGFFRKVSRVFDKATNADPDNEKSSIRIASFEFALK